ncbi:hypothetical protein [Virgibacillus salexigens]|uniref:DUF3298 domain-containing protein n=1 Tax=Virgibacillus kapii TaxID=1638645 RepID=A0ABQ2E0F4_9BACI|nr:hypothetical protein [Virgibacillus kapii]GGJ77398.1 hypothetical protein GCM10007111_43750 [Virgibacillus kapii]
MKKLVLLLLIVIVTACSSGNEEKQNDESKGEQEPTFTKEDIALAEEMIQYAQDLEKDFVETANKELKKQLEENPEKYRSEDLMGGFDQKKFKEDFMPLSKEKILDPFVERYGKHVVGKEDKEVQSRVNVSHFSQEENEGSNGIYKKLDKRQLFLTYQNLTLEEPVIEYHKDYGVHELVFPINKEETIYFSDTETFHLPNKITFYKSEEKGLLIGEFPFIIGNAFVDHFKDVEFREDTDEDLKQLPELK